MYTFGDFRTLRQRFREKLFHNDVDEPLICALHECSNAPGTVEITYPDGSKDVHVAEACNVAAVVASLDRLLSLPRSTVACEDLSEVLLLRLDVLREYVRDLVPYATVDEDQAEKTIRAWAGFLKHPRGFVLAHRCIVDWGDFDDAVCLDNDAVAAFSALGGAQEKDAAKDRYKNIPVDVCLPTVAELEAFLVVSRRRMTQAIEEYQ
jgi:hypothetical protein